MFVQGFFRGFSAVPRAAAKGSARAFSSQVACVCACACVGARAVLVRHGPAVPLARFCRLREGPAGPQVPPKLPRNLPACGAQAAASQATHFEHFKRHARAHNNVPFQQTSQNSMQAIIRHCPDRAYPHGAWQGGGSNNTLILGGVVGCAAGGYYAYSSGMLDGDALPAGKVPVTRPLCASWRVAVAAGQ
jgi:hypothetical protein